MRLARDRSHSPHGVGLTVAATPATPLMPRDVSDLTEDERSFCEVFYRLDSRLLKVAERYVDPQTAQDARSEVLLRFWRRWPQLSEEQRADRYIVQAVKHAALDALKARGAWTSLDEAEDEVERKAAEDYDAAASAASLQDLLDHTLAAMPPRRRAVLELLSEERVTYQQAAKALGISFGTIKTHYRLALAQLRGAYAKAGYLVEDAPRALLAAPTEGTGRD